MKCKTDKPGRHKDGSGHHHAMGVFHPGQSVRHFAFASSARPPNVAGPRLSITGAFNVESQPIALLNLVWIHARGLQRRDVQKYVRAAGVVSDETVTAFGI